MSKLLAGRGAMITEQSPTANGIFARAWGGGTRRAALGSRVRPTTHKRPDGPSPQSGPSGSAPGHRVQGRSFSPGCAGWGDNVALFPVRLITGN